MAARASSRNVREGIVGGLIGAALVAVWLLIYHAAHWPSAETAAVAPGVHAVIRYTVFPAVVFAMIGILVTYVIVSSQAEPSRGSSHTRQREVERGAIVRVPRGPEPPPVAVNDRATDR
jgi:hypothetical protein